MFYECLVYIHRSRRLSLCQNCGNMPLKLMAKDPREIHTSLIVSVLFFSRNLLLLAFQWQRIRHKYVQVLIYGRVRLFRWAKRKKKVYIGKYLVFWAIYLMHRMERLAFSVGPKYSQCYDTHFGQFSKFELWWRNLQKNVTCSESNYIQFNWY